MTTTKPDKRALLASLARELRQLRAAAPSLAARGSVDKIYEVYVLACLLRALRSIGATMQARDLSDRPTSNLKFRFAPGTIASPAAATTFIHVAVGGVEFEIQNGVRVMGKSGVLHELDVCLIDRAEAARCRQLGLRPSQSKVRFLAECKCYADTLPLGIGREYLGLNSEFVQAVKVIVSNAMNDELPRLLRAHRAMPIFGVKPTNTEREDGFVSWLVVELRRKLGIA